MPQLFPSSFDWFEILGGNIGGIPHLAKNERDMGHPAFVLRKTLQAFFAWYRRRSRRLSSVSACTQERNRCQPSHLSTPSAATSLSRCFWRASCHLAAVRAALSVVSSTLISAKPA